MPAQPSIAKTPLYRSILTMPATHHLSPEKIQHYLADNNINVSISLRGCARLDMAKRNIPAITRASVHYRHDKRIGFITTVI